MGQTFNKKTLAGARRKSQTNYFYLFTPAFMAEYFRYPGDIYCVVCDADISRSWAPLIPDKTKIKYCVPNERTKERLLLYGVNDNNIF